VVNNVKKPGSYSLIGSSVEPGEHSDETLVREIKEEVNMKVLSYKLLGYQKVMDTSSIDPVC
jgi:8-oxo-dGTP pyrophosphatase MutT (NUDIX family)